MTLFELITSVGSGLGGGLLVPYVLERWKERTAAKGSDVDKLATMVRKVTLELKGHIDPEVLGEVAPHLALTPDQLAVFVVKRRSRTKKFVELLELDAEELKNAGHAEKAKAILKRCIEEMEAGGHDWQKMRMALEGAQRDLSALRLSLRQPLWKRFRSKKG